MTIRVFKDRIEFGNYTLTSTPTGASLNGSIAASKLSTGFVVGQGNSFGFNHGITAPGNARAGYRFPFASDVITQSTASLVPQINSHRGTSHSSETHGYSTRGMDGFGNYGFGLPTQPASRIFNHYGPNFFHGSGNPISDGGQGSYYPITLTPISRFSFSSQVAAEDVGAIADACKSFYNSLGINIGLSSRLYGYVYGSKADANFTGAVDTIRRFSFTSAVTLAEIGYSSSRISNGAPYKNEIPIAHNPRSDFNGMIDGAALSTENYGYMMTHQSISTTGSAFSFYKKFPFANENTLTVFYVPSTASDQQNRPYMTGITGPNAGYWVGGLERGTNAVDYGPSGVGPIPSSYGGTTTILVPAASINRAHKFPFATDALSVIPYSDPAVGFGHSGTASGTKAYLLNGFGTGFHPTNPDTFRNSTQYTSTNSPMLISDFVTAKRKSFTFASESTMNNLSDSVASLLMIGSAHQY